MKSCDNRMNGFATLAEKLRSELVKKDGYAEESGFERIVPRNGWVQLYTTMQLFGVSLMFHDDNVSFLVGEIVRLGNFTLSPKSEYGVVVGKGKSGVTFGGVKKENMPESATMWHSYILEITEDLQNINREVEYVNKNIAGSESFCSDLKRYVLS